MEKRRVVVTGVGTVNPTGNTVEESWKGIREGKVGIGEITAFDSSTFSVHLAGEVKDFHPETVFDKRELKHMARFTQFAMIAAEEAMLDSGISGTLPPEEMGVIVSSGIGGLKTIEEEHTKGEKRGFERVSPFFIPMSISNMAAGEIAIRHKLKGICICPVTACAGGSNAVGDAFHRIRDGYETAMLCGGTEAAISGVGIGGVAGNGQVEIADAIAGLMKIADGKVILNGKDITGESIRKRCLDGISYIPENRQDVGLVMDFSLENNLVLKTYNNARFSRKGILRAKEIRANGEELIQKYDIRSGQGCQTIVRSMSGGNQQKAIIGREIELNSALMIFVQPTRGLDIGAIENIHKQIIAERDAGKAILLISLELDEIMNCADTIGVIYNGEIQKIADAKELSTNQVGEFMMGVKHEK